MTSESSCRHEYVRIYQRRLKGLERRLVSTRAYLPVGFKVGDFGHLSEGSFCFCVTCRKRLFPKRSQQEKDEARVERARVKQAGLAADFASAMADEEDLVDEPIRTAVGDGEFDEFEEKAVDDFDLESEKTDDFATDDDKLTVELQVDELEVEAVDVVDIQAEGVVLVADDDEETCALDEDIDI